MSKQENRSPVGEPGPAPDDGRRAFLGRSASAMAGLSAGVALGSLPARAFAQQDEVRVGWVRPTTGRLASSFAPLYIGGLIAIDEINAKGGIMGRKIVRVEEDDEGSPAKAPAVMRKLKDANISLVCGPVGSSQTLSALTTTTSSRMLHTAYAQGADVANGAKYPYFYQLVLNTDLQAELICKHIVEVLKAKKVGILQESTAFGEQGTAATNRFLKQAGIVPVATEAYPITAPSLDPYMTNLQRAGSEVVVAWVANIPNAGMAFNAMNTLRWYPPVIGHNGLFADSLFDLVPIEVLNNVSLTFLKAFTWHGDTMPGARQQEYAKKIMAHPEAKTYAANVAAGPFYDFLHLYKSVVESEKTFDPERLKRALDNVRGYDGMIGKISFSPEDHCGLKVSELTLARLGSSRDPKANGVFRERISA